MAVIVAVIVVLFNRKVSIVYYCNRMASFAGDVDLEGLVLRSLSADGVINDTMDFAAAHGVDHQDLVGTIKSLLVDAYVVDEQISKTLWALTGEGEQVVANGSPEYQVYNAVPADADGISMTQLQVAIGEIVKIGLGPCMKNKWLKKQGESVVKIASNVND